MYILIPIYHTGYTCIYIYITQHCYITRVRLHKQKNRKGFHVDPRQAFSGKLSGSTSEFMHAASTELASGTSNAPSPVGSKVSHSWSGLGGTSWEIAMAGAWGVGWERSRLGHFCEVVFGSAISSFHAWGVGCLFSLLRNCSQIVFGSAVSSCSAWGVGWERSRSAGFCEVVLGSAVSSWGVGWERSRLAGFCEVVFGSATSSLGAWGVGRARSRLACFCKVVFVEVGCRSVEASSGPDSTQGFSEAVACIIMSLCMIGSTKFGLEIGADPVARASTAPWPRLRLGGGSAANSSKRKSNARELSASSSSPACMKLRAAASPS